MFSAKILTEKVVYLKPCFLDANRPVEVLELARAGIIIIGKLYILNNLILNTTSICLFFFFKPHFID